jgi:thiosulfate/3-mercaptopyruvate sulfurtransferase
VNPLISADSLLAATDKPVLIDVTWNLSAPAGAPKAAPGRDAYDAGHVPGAHFVDLDTELAAPPGDGGRHPLPSATTVQAALRRAGVAEDSTVVVYDAANSMAAARAWWIFRYFGVRDVRVLDGGFAAWRAAGGEVTADVPEDGKGTFVATAGQVPILDAASAAELASTGVLLDARAPERFAGETEPLDKVAGHIPGAVNAPTAANVSADGHFLSADDLRARFTALGADGSAPVGAYCGSGVTAAHEALALQVAGIEAAVYVGSWSEWITDPDRPIATGRS